MKEAEKNLCPQSPSGDKIVMKQRASLPGHRPEPHPSAWRWPRHCRKSPGQEHHPVQLPAAGKRAGWVDARAAGRQRAGSAAQLWSEDGRRGHRPVPRQGKGHNEQGKAHQRQGTLEQTFRRQDSPCVDQATDVSTKISLCNQTECSRGTMSDWINAYTRPGKHIPGSPQHHEAKNTYAKGAMYWHHYIRSSSETHQKQPALITRP